MGMKYIVVDVEADGPAPGLYSMIQLGAVMVHNPSGEQWQPFSVGFCGELAPISDDYIPEALAVSEFTREETLGFLPPEATMTAFMQWFNRVTKHERPVLFVSDNAGFDWMFFNYYAWRYLDGNPLGFSPFSLTSFYKGYAKSMRASFKHLRKTRHSHNALDDARGNAEALCTLLNQMEVK